MEKFNLDYSDKNIPIPSWEDYKIDLLSKSQKFIKRITWKALQCLVKPESTEKKDMVLNLETVCPLLKK